MILAKICAATALIAGALLAPTAMAQTTNVALQAGQSIMINSTVLQGYGGYVNVTCAGSQQPPPGPPPPPSTINLGVTCGNGQGYCDCSSNQPNYPDVVKAEGLCSDYGFNHLISYKIAPALLGSQICIGLKGGCVTDTVPGNVICAQINCSY